MYDCFCVGLLSELVLSSTRRCRNVHISLCERIFLSLSFENVSQKKLELRCFSWVCSHKYYFEIDHTYVKHGNVKMKKIAEKQ